MAVLRLNGETGFRVEDVRDWFARIDHAYNSLYDFEALLNVTQPGRQFVTPSGGPLAVWLSVGGRLLPRRGYAF